MAPPLCLSPLALKPLDSALNIWQCPVSPPPPLPPPSPPPPPPGLLNQSSGFKIPQLPVQYFPPRSSQAPPASFRVRLFSKLDCGPLDTQGVDLLSKFAVFLEVGVIFRCVYFFKGCLLPTPIFVVAMFGGGYLHPCVYVFIEIV